jgi:hypothetical protein
MVSEVLDYWIGLWIVYGTDMTANHGGQSGMSVGHHEGDEGQPRKDGGLHKH